MRLAFLIGLSLAPSRADADPPSGQAVTAAPPRPLPRPAAWYEDVTRHSLYGILTAGFLYTHVFGPAPANGFGAEATYVLYRNGGMVGAGLFAQAQTYSGTHGRYALGAQLNYSVFGAELGASYRASADGFRGTPGLHVGPFFSLGVVSLGLHLTVPLARAEGDRSAYPAEFGLSAALKLPWLGLPDGPLPIIGQSEPRGPSRW